MRSGPRACRARRRTAARSDRRRSRLQRPDADADLSAADRPVERHGGHRLSRRRLRAARDRQRRRRRRAPAAAARRGDVHPEVPARRVRPSGAAAGRLRAVRLVRSRAAEFGVRPDPHRRDGRVGRRPPRGVGGDAVRRAGRPDRRRARRRERASGLRRAALSGHHDERAVRARRLARNLLGAAPATALRVACRSRRTCGGEPAGVHRAHGRKTRACRSRTASRSTRRCAGRRAGRTAPLRARRARFRHASGFRVRRPGGPIAGSTGCARTAGCPRRPARRRVASSATVAWGRGFEGQRKADLGNGQFLNPILAGDHPDPSILRDGDDYYMTFSSFDAYPGLVIWHSRDLVNWQPMAPALFKNVGSVWAPDLVKHQGRYYIYFPARTDYRSNYVIWADSHSRAVERADRSEDRADRSRTRRRSRRHALPVPQRRQPRATRARRPLGRRRDEEDLRRLEVSGRLDRRRLRAGRPEDPAARRLLLHGARRGRHGRAADRPHDRRGAIENDRGTVGELALQPDRAHDDRGRSAGGRRGTAR